MSRCLLTAAAFAFWAYAKTGQAQVEAPRTLAAAGATVAEASVWGAAENPAADALSRGRFAAQAYGFNHLEVAELSRLGLDLAARLGTQEINLSLQAFTPPGYTVGAGHVGVNRRLGESLRGGIRLGAVRQDLDEYGVATALVAQAGLQYAVSARLRAAAHYTYVDRPLLPLAEHRLRVGVDYASSARVHLLLAVWQPVGARLAGGVSVRYDPAERLRLRAGVRAGGTAFVLGVEGELAGGLRVGLTGVVYQSLPAAAGYGVAWSG